LINHKKDTKKEDLGKKEKIEMIPVDEWIKKQNFKSTQDIKVQISCLIK
jgi:hypothetical protein